MDILGKMSGIKRVRQDYGTLLEKYMIHSRRYWTSWIDI